MKKSLRAVGVILCVIFSGNVLAQNLLNLSKVFVGFQVEVGFLNNAIKSEPVALTSTDFIVRNSSLKGRSGGNFSHVRFILGYRINNSMSVDFRAGVGGFGSTVNTAYRSSQTYNNIGTHSASDMFATRFTGLSFETSFKHKIFHLNTRKHLRFINGRIGLGMITNNDGRGISYEEHYWPFIGITHEKDDSPVDYRGTKLLKISNFPFTKLGVDYESRGKTGFTFAFDVYMYQPNLFYENEVEVKENKNATSGTKIYLNDQLVSYSVSISFFLNRLFVKKE